jgi:hypothetical protein
MKRIVGLLLLFICIMSCTENSRARKFGGTQEISLEAGEKFINATWKDSDLWILVEDSINDVYVLKEHSQFGVLEGKIIINKK